MCGILACIGIKQKITSSINDKLNSSLKGISYRGPNNSSSIFLSDGNNFEVFLGHNRLSIIDLANHSNQPFCIDEKYYIIFNGEIYNYLELREELQNKGYKFKTESDTEVLLRLYIESGVSRFGELNGMWSFVIVDLLKNKVIVSRDRFGEKPLYKYVDSNGLLFLSSEIKQILPFVRDRSINLKTMSNYLHHYLLDANDESFFNDIEKIPAKSVITIDLITGERICNAYWDYEKIDLHGIQEFEAIEHYRTLLINAINLRLRSDVKIGNTLSGGLDSSSIAVLADSLNEGNLINYSVVSKNKKFSEEAYIDLLSRKNNINVKKINFDDVDPWALVDKVIWHHDEPILSFSTVAHYAMLQNLKEQSGITVVLSGQGGDEGLAGYNKYYFFYLRKLLGEKEVAKFLQEFVRIIPRFKSEFTFNAAKRYINFQYFNSYRQQKEKSLIRLPLIANELSRYNDFKERQKLDYDRYSVPALCHYEDRNSMAHSLEMRLPFLDYKLVNFSVNLPESYKIRNGFSKFILRKSIYELPNEVRWRFDKKGFTLDESSKFTRKVLKDSLIPLFKDSILGDLGIIDSNLVLDELYRVVNGKSNMWTRDLARIVFAEKWAKIFL